MGGTRDVGTGDLRGTGRHPCGTFAGKTCRIKGQAQAQFDQTTAQHTKADQISSARKALYSTQSLTKPNYDQAEEAFNATQAAMSNAKAALLNPN